MPGFWRLRRLVHRAIALARRSLATALYWSGALAFWRRRRRPRNSAIVLMYHSIGGAGLSPDIVVSQEHFRRHIEYLRRHYCLLSLDHVVGLLEGGRQVPRHAVVVTLDDGYRDNYEKALPILKRYRCPATLFIAVESVMTGRVPWSQTLWRWLQSTRELDLRISWGGGNETTTEKVLSLRTEQDRAEARIWLRAFAGGLGRRERQDFLKALAQRLACSVEPDTDRSPAMLTWDQLREMARWGITIGSHTVTHPRLSGLDSGTVRQELVESRSTLGRELSADVRLFAYPFGGWQDFNEDTKAAVGEAGYRAACAAVVGNGGSSVDLRALHRLYVPDEPVWMFALRLLHLESDSRLIAWTLRTD